jgi:hypothetical protein
MISSGHCTCFTFFGRMCRRKKNPGSLSTTKLYCISTMKNFLAPLSQREPLNKNFNYKKNNVYTFYGQPTATRFNHVQHANAADHDSSKVLFYPYSAWTPVFTVNSRITLFVTSHHHMTHTIRDFGVPAIFT